MAWLLCALAGRAAAQPPARNTAPASPSTLPATAAAPGGPAAPGWRPDNRLIISGDWDNLTGVQGHGGGGSLGFLAELNPDTVLDFAGEYQSLAGSRWAFGSFTAAYGHALTSNSRWNISAEAHEGVGQTQGTARSGTLHWRYGIEALGAGLSVPGGVTLSAEERQIDVYNSHGSLPKAGLAKSWGSHWLTSIGYAQSEGGNLSTQYGLARIDFLSAPIQLFVGGDAGHVAPAVLNIEGVLLPEARKLTEVFAGLTRPNRYVDFSLLGDRIDLHGIVRLTVTLTATVHLQ